ncbi:hypothetical protein Tco_0216081 [Tanacetum coccineum]
MKEIDWKKVKITDEVMEYVIPKYGKTNWLLNDSYSLIILEDIYNIFYKDEAELTKGEGKMDDLVDALEKGKSKLMVSRKGTKKASVDLFDALDLQNRIKKLFEDLNMFVKAKKTKEAKEAEVVEVPSDEEDSSDEAFFGDEDLVLFNHVKYPLSDDEIRMFKERPTTSTSTRSRAPTASTGFRALIASTSNPKPAALRRSRAPTASTISRALISSASSAQLAALRGYRKIGMTGCVLDLKAPNDPNAPPPSTTRKRKP